MIQEIFNNRTDLKLNEHISMIFFQMSFLKDIIEKVEGIAGNHQQQQNPHNPSSHGFNPQGQQGGPWAQQGKPDF